MKLSKTNVQNDFPEGLGAPALRALSAAKIRKLSDLKKWTKKDLLSLHGLGPKAVSILNKALAAKKVK